MYVASEWVQVLMEKRWYLPRCCGCGPKEPVCSLVHSHTVHKTTHRLLRTTATTPR